MLLDATSTRSVPNLLTPCRLWTSGLLAELKCLGIVANGVSYLKDKLIAREAEIWNELPTICRVAWESDVHLFETKVPDSGRIAEAAGRVLGQGEWPCLALDDDRMRGVFEELVKEIKTRIAHES